MRLLGEKLRLRRGGGGGAGAGVAWGAAGDADYAEDLHFGEGRSRDEHAQVVAVEVGGR